MRNDFAVFILSNKRAENVITIDTLKKCGYTGKIYIVIDDEDPQADIYYKLYGDKVIMFSKAEMDTEVDTGDNLGNHRGVIYARNKVFDIARELNIEYFLVLDDDYKSFEYRRSRDGKLTVTKCKQLDRMFSEIVKFFELSGAVTVTLAQGGDFIGGHKLP